MRIQKILEQMDVPTDKPQDPLAEMTAPTLNQEVARFIAKQLSNRFPDSTINVRCSSDGTVTLSGGLDSKERMDEVVDFVQSLPYGNKLVNNLTVPTPRQMQLPPDNPSVVQSADPYSGKYRIDDEEWKAELELSYLGKSLPTRQLNGTQFVTNSEVNHYRIIAWNNKEEGRLIGNAILVGNQLDIEWEVAHDGKRYMPVPKETQQIGKFVNDGETILLILQPDAADATTDATSEIANVRFQGAVAVKVKEYDPPQGTAYR